MTPANPDGDPILKDLQAEESERQEWIAKVAERDNRTDLSNFDTDELKKLWEAGESTNALKKASATLFQKNSKVCFIFF